MDNSFNEYNRFSKESREVLKLSQDNAQALLSPHIGADHILLGLTLVKKASSTQILKDLGVNNDSILTVIKQIDPPTVPKEKVLVNGLSINSKRAIETATEIAITYGYETINTEHILFGLIHKNETSATDILEYLNVDLEFLYQNLENTFKANAEINNIENGNQTKDPDDHFDDVFNNLIGDMWGTTSASGGSQDVPEFIQPDQGPDIPQNNQQGRSKSRQSKELQALEYYCFDLTAKAAKGEIDPVIGRTKEIDRMISILNRRTKNNPVLTGEPGVGKTAIAEGLAIKIINDEVPAKLINKRILSLDMTSVVAGTKYRGEFEERIKMIIEGIKISENIILFIDELHTIIGAGASEGSLDAANILKPALSRGTVQIIGATTTDEYRKHIEKDSALERRLQPILVDEPSDEHTFAILKGLRPLFEAHHDLKITDEALSTAINYSKRYIGDRFLPDKAVDLIDEASSIKGISASLVTDSIKKLKSKIVKISSKKDKAVEDQQFEKATKYRDEEAKLIKEVQVAQKEIAKNAKKKSKETALIESDDIAKVVSDITGIPVHNLVKTEIEKLQNLEGTLKDSIIGQEQAILQISKAIRRSRTGISNKNRPIGSFIFMGPTGVGKTELVKSLTKTVYNDEKALIRIDMSEFMERHNISRLTGASAGYIGYDEGGQLTEAVRRRPYSVVLFDEIEKAHPEIFNLLLQILEDGFLTDAKGRKINFRNTIIIMTSNIGSEKLTQEAKSIGFNTGEDLKNSLIDFDEAKGEVVEKLHKKFAPEFINRIDNIIVFNPLELKDIKEIIKLQIKELNKRLKEKFIKIVPTDKALTQIINIGHNPSFGARPIRRTIQDRIENNISELILDGKLENGGTINVDFKSGDFTFTIKKGIDKIKEKPKKKVTKKKKD